MKICTKIDTLWVTLEVWGESCFLVVNLFLKVYKSSCGSKVEMSFVELARISLDSFELFENVKNEKN